MNDHPSLFDSYYEPENHARVTDPPTSLQAAQSVKTLNSHCASLLYAYGRLNGHGGLTAEEAGHAADIDAWAASKRNSDLRRMGYIEPLVVDETPTTRMNQSGRKAMVFVITTAGRTALAELRR